ncbi:MAG: stage V sporulation T C-terminal domain-containing protein [Clostridia bacterium]|nr:stage V sporulation T C-terminal domain-containing protein [Clostridia bacterium]MDD4386229.1 stage V sporulation T C-terminal domain-containing protein [Clostridia bacterium]
MILKEKFKKFIDISVKLSFGSTIYITDLENVLYAASELFSNVENKEISLELLKQALLFNNDSNKNVILSDDKVIPIYNEQSKDIKYITQIILPIIIDNKVFGTLINTHNCTYYEEINLKYAKTTLEFVELFIRDSKY